jgi:hypothetical protein
VLDTDEKFTLTASKQGTFPNFCSIHPRMTGKVVVDLVAQPPFCACVRDPEPLTLGIALRIAARLGDHHRQIASMIVGVAHTLVKERCLQPTTPQLRNRS